MSRMTTQGQQVGTHPAPVTQRNQSKNAMYHLSIVIHESDSAFEVI